MGNILYQMEGGEQAAPEHQLVEVSLHSEADAACVKGAVEIALRAQCGNRHYLKARRLNQKGLVLNWSVSAWCAPADYRPKSWEEIEATLPGIISVLHPADREQAEADEQARLERAAAEAAEFFQRQHERRQAAAVLL